MSCLMITTVNLAVITAVALAPGVLWLEDVGEKRSNFKLLGPHSFF